MADDAVVTLIAPNGMQVSVAESKKSARLASRYRLPEKRTSASKRRATAADDAVDK